MRTFSLPSIAILVAFVFIPALALASTNAGDFAGSVAVGAGYANTFTGPTNGMIVQGSVGIGTNSVSYPLQVVGPGTNTTDLFVTDQSTATMSFIGNTAGGGGSPTLQLNTGASSGSTAGAYINMLGKLESWVSVVATSNTSGQRVMRFGNGSNGCTNCFAIQSLNDSATIINATPFMLANSAPNNSLTISSNGSVGLGTSSPQSQLHVSGGEVQVGSSGASCATANNGAIRYSSGVLSYCTGTTWTTIAGASLPSLTNGDFWVGNGSNVATAVAMSGDCTISNTGAITCTKTNGTAFGSLATQSSVNLATQATGSLPSANLPTLTSANIWVGNASNAATAVAMSGDCTISNAGAITCTKTNGTAFGSLATQYGVNLSSQATGTLQAGQFPALTGDVTTTAGSFATTVAAIQGTTVSGTTGTGNVVFSASPTLTGTLTGASSNWSGDAYFGQSTNPATSRLTVQVQTGSANGINMQTTSDTGASYPIAFYNHAGGLVGYIVSTYNSAAINSVSDKRLKENIKPLTDSGAIIDGMQPVTFDWKYVDGHPTGIGFIAQDLHKILPSAVAVGDAGEPDMKGRVAQAWAIDYSKPMPVVVAELKSLRARLAIDDASIQALQKRLSDDEATIAALKAKLNK